MKQSKQLDSYLIAQSSHLRPQDIWSISEVHKKLNNTKKYFI